MYKDEPKGGDCGGYDRINPFLEFETANHLHPCLLLLVVPHLTFPG
jgi:hypothetical protein